MCFIAELDNTSLTGSYHKCSGGILIEFRDPEMSKRTSQRYGMGSFERESLMQTFILPCHNPVQMKKLPAWERSVIVGCVMVTPRPQIVRERIVLRGANAMILAQKDCNHHFFHSSDTTKRGHSDHCASNRRTAMISSDAKETLVRTTCAP